MRSSAIRTSQLTSATLTRNDLSIATGKMSSWVIAVYAQFSNFVDVPQQQSLFFTTASLICPLPESSMARKLSPQANSSTQCRNENLIYRLERPPFQPQMRDIS